MLNVLLRIFVKTKQISLPNLPFGFNPFQSPGSAFDGCS